MNAPVLMTKRCSRCEEEKTAGEFHRNRSKPDGLSTWCKVCGRAGSKLTQAKRRAQMGDEAWREYVRENVRRSRQRRNNGTERRRQRIISRAFYELRDRHRAEYDALIRLYEYEEPPA